MNVVVENIARKSCFSANLPLMSACICCLTATISRFSKLSNPGGAISRGFSDLRRWRGLGLVFLSAVVVTGSKNESGTVVTTGEGFFAAYIFQIYFCGISFPMKFCDLLEVVQRTRLMFH